MRAIQRARPTPTSAQLLVTIQLHCHPPVRAATHATSGGPVNWPKADHCCIQPTVLETVDSLGASRTASENKVPEAELAKFAKKYGGAIRNEIVFRGMHAKVVQFLNDNAVEGPAPTTPARKPAGEKPAAEKPGSKGKKKGSA